MKSYLESRCTVRFDLERPCSRVLIFQPTESQKGIELWHNYSIFLFNTNRMSYGFSRESR